MFIYNKNKLTTAIHIEGVQLMSNTTLKNISLANLSSSGQITSGILHINNSLSMRESQDGSNIILDLILIKVYLIPYIYYK